MKWYTYLLCAILIVAGIFSSIVVIDMFSVESSVVGGPKTFESENNYNVVSNFNLDGIVLDSEYYQQYSAMIEKEPVRFDGSLSDYNLIFNNKPVSNLVISPGKILGDLIIDFKDLEGEIITTATVNIKIEYLASCTRVYLTMENINTSVSYFNSYISINGANLKVLIKEK